MLFDTAPWTARPRTVPLDPGPLDPGSLDPVRLDPGLPVLLLRTDRNLFHHGTLAVIRSLGRAGVPVHAILEGRTNPSSRSRYLSRAHPWGPPVDRPDDLLAHLRAIGARIGRPALLVPMDDAGAIFAAEHAAGLAAHFAFPRQDPAAPRGVADKARLLEACRRHGVPCPPSLLPESAADVDEAAAAFGLPLIAKWARPWRLRPGMRSTTLVPTLGELHRLYAATRDRAPSGGAAGGAGDGANGGAGPLILQRRIPPAGGDWFFQGYFDENGDRLFGGTGRKHLAHPPQAGHTVAGEWVESPELERLAVRIVRLLGCRGLVDLDFRLDARTGEYHLLDFNPRIGAQFRLFTDLDGLDLARVMHLHQSGRPIPAPRPAPGRTLLVENHYLARTARRPRHEALRPPGAPASRRTQVSPSAPPSPETPPSPGTPASPGAQASPGAEAGVGGSLNSGAEPHSGRELRFGQGARARLRPLWETLRPLREADEFAWFAGDDLPPFLAMGRRSALRAVERLRTR